MDNRLYNIKYTGCCPNGSDCNCIDGDGLNEYMLKPEALALLYKNGTPVIIVEI